MPIGCHPSSGFCETAQGTVIWDPTGLEHPCQYEEKGTYNATLMGDHLLIEALQMAVIVGGLFERTVDSSCVPEGIRATPQGILIQIDRSFPGDLRFEDIGRRI